VGLTLFFDFWRRLIQINKKMRKKLNGILTLFLVLLVQITFAQTETVTGTVTDPDGLPLPGVNVLIKGQGTGTQTDFDGNYTVRASSNQTLIFKYVGFKTQNIEVGEKSEINVSLSIDAGELDEVVITGYNTFSKEKSSIASTKITSKTIENRPNASLIQTLAGQVPGLDISTNSGQPGANSLVNLRGVSSINGNTEPLFLLDGIPINEDNFRSINANEIASIDVLKDAGATAIYGSRGANGVILITTRRGGFNTPLKIQYTGITNFATLQGNNYDLGTGQDALRLERQFSNFRGVPTGRGGGEGNSLFPGNDGIPLTDAEIAQEANFDWLNFFFRTGVTQNHTLNLSSGSDKGSQFTSLGYFEQEGVLQDSKLQRFNLRNNTDGRSDNGKFKYSTSVSLNYSKDNSLTSIGTNGVNQNPLFGAFSSLPYLTPDGYPGGAVLAEDFILDYAPYYIIDKLRTSDRLDEELKMIAGITSSYDLGKSLTLGYTGGIDYQSETFLNAQDPISRNQLRFNPAVDGFATQFSTRELSINSTLSLNWNEVFGKHTISTGAYTEYFKAHFRQFGFTANGLDPRTYAPGDGSGFLGDTPDDDARVDTVSAEKLDAGLFSYFGTFNYDYDTRFGFSALIRRDASYRFATTNRWGTFGSVSGRWNISNEAFMDEVSFVDDLKLRGSYGSSGNQRITGNSYWSGADLPFSFFSVNSGYGNQDAIRLAQIGNSSLTWETVIQSNIGVDFALFKSRLRGAIDFYSKKTEDLFQSTPISGVNGQFSINANTGSLTNEGVDLQLDYDLINNEDFRLSLNVVGNYNKITLSDIPSDDGEIIGIGRNGGKLGEYFELRYAGVNPANGNLLFLDANGDLTEDPNPESDRVWLDKNLQPDAQGSFGINLDYKGFFLQTQFNWEVGRDQFDGDYSRFTSPDVIGDFRLSNDLFRAWTPTNRVTDIPSLTATNDGVFGSDRFLVPMDYIRLRFASVGYNFSKDVLDKIGVSNFRLFVNAENLFTLSEFRGFDAASRNNGLQYPTPRIISIGIELGI